jgi:glutathione S-transferase
MPHPLPALITLLTVLLQLGVMFNVGRTRGKYKIAPPATSGHPVVERALRIQMNTVESTLMFLPALWVFAIYRGDTWAGILGAAWLVGRVAYAIGYQIAPAKRSAGFLIGFLAIVGLTLGGLISVVRALFF